MKAVEAISPKASLTILGHRKTVLLLAAALMGEVSLQSDELRTVSGERFLGKTLSVGEHTVVFSSSSVGKVTVARTNVLELTLSTGSGTNRVAKTNTPALTAATNQNSEIAAILKTLPSQPQLADSVQTDLLAQAGPEAAQKFNQMLRGLLTGSMSVSDLRAEAKSVRDQARALRADLGPEAGGILDGYLEILDKFLAQTPAAAAPKTPPK